MIDGDWLLVDAGSIDTGISTRISTFGTDFARGLFSSEGLAAITALLLVGTFVLWVFYPKARIRFARFWAFALLTFVTFLYMSSLLVLAYHLVSVQYSSDFVYQNRTIASASEEYNRILELRDYVQSYRTFADPRYLLDWSGGYCFIRRRIYLRLRRISNHPVYRWCLYMANDHNFPRIYGRTANEAYSRLRLFILGYGRRHMVQAYTDPDSFCEHHESKVAFRYRFILGDKLLYTTWHRKKDQAYAEMMIMRDRIMRKNRHSVHGIYKCVTGTKEHFAFDFLKHSCRLYLGITQSNDTTIRFMHFIDYIDSLLDMCDKHSFVVPSLNTFHDSMDLSKLFSAKKEDSNIHKSPYDTHDVQGVGEVVDTLLKSSATHATLGIVTLMWGVMQGFSLDISFMSRLKIFAEHTRSVIGATTGAEMIVSYVRILISCFTEFMQTGDVKVFLRTSGDNMDFYTKADSILGKANEYKFENTQQTDLMFLDAELAEVILIGEYAISVSPINHKVALSKVLMALRSKRNEISTRIRSTATRQAPFSVLIEGPSSIGKSSITTLLTHTFAINHPGLSEPHNPQGIYTRTIGEAFWSQLTNTIWCVILDDLGRNLAKAAEARAENHEIISIINNAAFYPPMAEAQEKGKICLAPRFVIGTTNARDLNASQTMKCGAAVLRRFPYVITPTVRPQFRKNDGTLNSDLVKDETDIWTFQIDKVNIKNGEIGYDPIITVAGEREHSTRQMLVWFVAAIERHFDAQANASSYKAKLGNQCTVCKLPSAFCNCTTLSPRSDDDILEADDFRHTLVTKVPDHTSYPKKERSYAEVAKTEVMEVRCGGPDVILREEGCPCEKCVEMYPLPITKKVQSTWTYTSLDMANEFVLGATSAIHEVVGGPSDTIRFSVWIFTLTCLYAFTRFLIRQFVSLAITTAIRTVQIESMRIANEARSLLGFRVPVPAAVADMPIADAVGTPWFGRAVLAYERARDLSRNPFVRKMVLGLAIASTTVVLYRWWHTVSVHGITDIEQPGKMPSESVKSTANVWVNKNPMIDLKFLTEQSRCTLESVMHNNVQRALGFLESSDQKVHAFNIFGQYWLLPRHVGLKILGKRFRLVRTINDGQGHCDFIVKEIYHHPTEDFSIVHIPSLNGPNLVPYLGVDNVPGSLQAHVAFLRDTYNVVEIPLVTCSRDRFSFANSIGAVCGRTTDIPMSYDYPRNWDSRNGDCGSPLYVASRGTSRILGFHVGEVENNIMGTRTCICARVPVDWVKSIQQTLDITSGTKCVCQSDIDVRDVDDIPITLDKLHNKCPIRYEGFIGTSLFSIGTYGANLASRFKTSFHESIMYDFWTRNGYYTKKKPIPASFNSTRWMPKRDFCLNAGAQKERDIDPRILEECRLHYKKRFRCLPEKAFENLSPISEEANLYGTDALFIEGVNFRTSYGFPCNKAKKFVLKPMQHSKFPEGTYALDQRTTDWILRAERKLARHERANFIFNSSFKDECVSEKKISQSKVRIFQAITFPGNFLLRKYFLPLVALCQTYNYISEMAVGCDIGSADWDEFAKRHNAKGWHSFCGDYTNYDQRMANSFQIAAWNVLIDIARERGDYTEEQIRIMESLAVECSQPLCNFFGDFILFNGSQPSGHALTVINNSIVNSLYMRYAFYVRFGSLDLFDENVRMMTYGDDNIVTVSEKISGQFNQIVASECLARFGVIYTDAAKSGDMKPFDSAEEMSFLKRKFRYEGDLVFAPLEMDSICNMLLHTDSDEGNKYQVAASALLSSVHEAFQYGRIFYEEHCSLVQKCMDEIPNLRPWNEQQGGIPSYEALYAQRVAKQSRFAVVSRPFGEEETRLFGYQCTGVPAPMC